MGRELEKDASSNQQRFWAKVNGSRRTKDQIFVVKQIVEKTIEKNKKTYMAFVDLEKAYDNVSREKLWVVLDKY